MTLVNVTVYTIWGCFGINEFKYFCNAHDMSHDNFLLVSSSSSKLCATLKVYVQVVNNGSNFEVVLELMLLKLDHAHSKISSNNIDLQITIYNLRIVNYITTLRQTILMKCKH